MMVRRSIVNVARYYQVVEAISVTSTSSISTVVHWLPWEDVRLWSLWRDTRARRASTSASSKIVLWCKRVANDMIRRSVVNVAR
jgi:hypothetical protein